MTISSADFLINILLAPGPEKPVAVIVPVTCNAVAGVVVPIPTLLFVASTTSVLVSNRRSLPAVNVPVTVAVPVTASVFAVIEPALLNTTPVSLSFVTCNRYNEFGVVVPIPNLDVIFMASVSALKLLLAAVNVPLTVIDPVEVIVVAVIEPALSTLKTLPAIAKVEAVTEPVVVMVVAVMEPEVSTLKPPALPAVIEPVVVNVDTVVEPAVRLDTVVAPAFNVPEVVMELGVIAEPFTVRPVIPAPFPEKYPAVTVPFV